MILSLQCAGAGAGFGFFGLGAVLAAPKALDESNDLRGQIEEVLNRPTRGFGDERAAQAFAMLDSLSVAALTEGANEAEDRGLRLWVTGLTFLAAAIVAGFFSVWSLWVWFGGRMEQAPASSQGAGKKGETKRKGRWVYRPRFLLKAFAVPQPYIFLGGLFGTWFAALWLAPPGPARYTVWATALQLAGLGVVVAGLWQRGTAFEGTTPLRGLRSFFQRVRAAFYQGPAVVLKVQGASHGTSAASAKLGVRPRVETLDQKVAWLEEQVKELKDLRQSDRKEAQQALNDLRKALTEGDRELSHRLKAVESDLKAGMVQGLALEWIGVLWIAIGLILVALVETPGAL